MLNQKISKEMYDKKIFKEATGVEKGFFSWFDPSYQRYVKSYNHQVISQKLLKYYKPNNEGTDEGFGEYGVFAGVLNNEGERELKAIVQLLDENKLLNDVGTIRYESQSASGFCWIDGLDGNHLTHQYSTDNVYIYVLTNDNVNIHLKDLRLGVACDHPKYGKSFYPIINDLIFSNIKH